MKPLHLALALTLLASTSFAADPKAAMEKIVPEISGKISTPTIISAIEASNKAHTSAGDAEIKKMDAEWATEVAAKKGAMIDAALKSPAATELKKIADSSKGLYTEIIVTDNKGLNVAQSSITSDFWQGDEAKFTKAWNGGAGATFVSDIEKDESTQMLQAQLSFPVKDAAGKAIGTATVGVNVEALGN